MIEMIILIFIGLLLGWRETQILIDRKSWSEYAFHKWFWGRNWYGKWYKDFDSFHAINGLIILLFVYLLYIDSNLIKLFSWNGWFSYRKFNKYRNILVMDYVLEKHKYARYTTFKRL